MKNHSVAASFYFEGRTHYETVLWKHGDHDYNDIDYRYAGLILNNKDERLL